MNKKQYRWEEFAENADQILDDFSPEDIIKITDQPIVVISQKKYLEFLEAKKYVLAAELSRVEQSIAQVNVL